MIAPEVKHFVFEVPEAEHLPYTAGQFVSLSREIGGRNFTRAYSTCSPARGNRFELCLNLVQDGHFSPFLFRMQPGETVEMRGPLGYFTWRTPVLDSILVATGTGVAPFRGMLHEYLSSGGGRQITLIFGVRYEQSLLYREEFEEFASRHENFRFWPTLTRSSESWTGKSGRVQQWTYEALGDRRDMDVYICGMKAMVDELRTGLKASGLDRKHIVFEKYD